MKIIDKLLKTIKESKGVGTAKGKYIDYKEAHALQYNYMKGLFIMDPRKLADNVNALVQDKEQWENSQGQYKDYALVGGYMTSKVMMGATGTGLLTGTGIC